MRLPRRTYGSLELMLTPMIDVVFLLLVFFVVTASFRPPEWMLPSNLLTEGGSQPRVTTDPELIDLEHVIVKIFWQAEQPTWWVNEQPVAGFPDVQQRLAAVADIRQDIPVLIDPQDATPLHWVIQTYDAARIVGFQKVQFAVGSPLAGAQEATR